MDCKLIYSVSFLLRVAQTLRMYKWDGGGEVGMKGRASMSVWPSCIGRTGIECKRGERAGKNWMINNEARYGLHHVGCS
jgi:hypothetical protein